MKRIIVELLIDPLGCTDITVRNLVTHYLPEYITHDGYMVQVEDARILREDEDEEAASV